MTDELQKKKKKKYFSECQYLKNILDLNPFGAFYLFLVNPKEMSPASKSWYNGTPVPLSS